MIYLLDTNTCIQYLNRRSASIYRRLTTFSPDDVCICDVVKFELYYGAYKSARTLENLSNLDDFFADLNSLPFDDGSAKVCGQIRASLQAKGTPIGAYDLQIAAIAIAHQLILVTHNTREFSKIASLTLEDWE